MASSVLEGDWVEGTPKWWWKYVMPSAEIFYAQLLAQRARAAGPYPLPWLQRASAEVMEGLTMFHAAAAMGEREGSARLQHEAYAQLSRAVKSLGAEAGFVGVDGDVHSPINPHTRGNGGKSRAAA